MYETISMVQMGQKRGKNRRDRKWNVNYAIKAAQSNNDKIIENSTAMYPNHYTVAILL